MDRETKYTVLAEEIKMGFSCFHLKLESTFSTEMSGTMMGMAISNEGEGESTSEVWFAYKKGLLVEYYHSTFVEGTNAFSGQMSSTNPYTNESNSALKLMVVSKVL